MIPRSIVQSRSRDDLCKISRVANQPHIQALASSSSTMNKENHHERSSSIPIIKSGNRALSSPIPSPSDYTYGSSIPRSLERPKSKKKNNKKVCFKDYFNPFIFFI